MNAEQIAALNAYYEKVGGSEPAKDMIYTTIALPTPDKEKLKKDQEEIAKLTGDKTKGEEVYNNACKFCHADGTKIKSVPSLFRDFEGNQKSITYMSRFGKKVHAVLQLRIIIQSGYCRCSCIYLSKSGKITLVKS
jgi:hypothetical protein